MYKRETDIQRDREKISVVYKLVSELVGYVWGRSTASPHT